MPELTLEQLGNNIDNINKAIGTFEASQKAFMAKVQKAMEEKDKKHDASHDDEGKKAKRAKRDAALKAALAMEDEDKKEAAIKTANDEFEDKKEVAKKGMTDEEKEEKAAVASILGEKKSDLSSKIMTASKIMNPQKLSEIEARLKVASITELQKEWETMKPFVAHLTDNVPAPIPQAPQMLPFFANIMGDPGQVDKNQLNANSPDSAFTKYSTAELVEMNR